MFSAQAIKQGDGMPGHLYRPNATAFRTFAAASAAEPRRFAASSGKVRALPAPPRPLPPLGILERPPPRRRLGRCRGRAARAGASSAPAPHPGPFGPARPGPARPGPGRGDGDAVRG